MSVSPRHPLICAHPVTPGFTLAREVPIDRVMIKLVGGLRFKRMRARIDQGEIALQHVEELREFVEAGPAQYAADTSDTRIVSDHLRRARLRFGFDIHGAELENVDHLIVEAHALLPEQGRASRIKLHRDRN